MIDFTEKVRINKFEADFVPMLWDFDCDFISVQSGKLINNHDTFFEEYCKYDMSDSIT